MLKGTPLVSVDRAGLLSGMTVLPTAEATVSADGSTLSAGVTAPLFGEAALSAGVPAPLVGLTALLAAVEAVADSAAAGAVTGAALPIEMAAPSGAVVLAICRLDEESSILPEAITTGCSAVDGTASVSSSPAGVGVATAGATRAIPRPILLPAPRLTALPTPTPRLLWPALIDRRGAPPAADEDEITDGDEEESETEWDVVVLVGVDVEDDSDDAGEDVLAVEDNE